MGGSHCISHNIPAVEFITTGAAMASFMPDADFPFPEIYLRDYEKDQITLLKELSRNHQEDKDRPGECMEQSCDIILIKAFKEIERKYFDYLSDMLDKKIVSVGLLVEDTDQKPEDKDSNIIGRHNKKDPCSTVFVSFGGELFLSKEEMEEVALGLELSSVNFIWVIRLPKGEKAGVEDALPEGFLERVGERGMVVEGWAPQTKILGHGSIGGFVSHCGWNSVMKALKCGVPIIAIPVLNDQPINARVLEDVGVGVEIVKEKNGRIQRTEVAKVIKQVMLQENGEALRSKGRLLSDNIRSKGEEEIYGLVEELAKLCNK